MLSFFQVKLKFFSWGYPEWRKLVHVLAICAGAFVSSVFSSFHHFKAAFPPAVLHKLRSSHPHPSVADCFGHPRVPLPLERRSLTWHADMLLLEVFPIVNQCSLCLAESRCFCASLRNNSLEVVGIAEMLCPSLENIFWGEGSPRGVGCSTLLFHLHQILGQLFVGGWVVVEKMPEGDCP